nr:T9SS type A sorting domain-containing protein [uncultured Flavobacterium sp.]
MKKFLLLFLLQFNYSVFAQPFNEYTKRWATYIGGQGTRFSASVADSEGNIIAVGEITGGINLILQDESYYNSFATNHDLLYDTSSVVSQYSYQTLIVKFSPDGELLESGYLPIYTYQIEIDSEDNLYITGSTQKNNIGTNNVWMTTPLTELALLTEKFILTKLNPDLSTVWCTYIPSQSIGEFCFDENYNIYGVGSTGIDHSITTPNTFQSAFITEYNNQGHHYENGLVYKLNQNGQLVWSSYYGVGTTGYAVSFSNNELTTSFIKNNSNELIQYDDYYYTTDAYQQTSSSQIISKFNVATGQRTYSTYLGNSDLEFYSIVSADDNYYFLGNATSSLNDELISDNAFQTTFAGFYDLYLGKFDTNFNPIWGTYIGGNDYEDASVSQLKLKDKTLYFSAPTNSNNFINSPNPYQNNSGGDSDLFMMKFSTDGDFIWGSFFGGNSLELLGSVTPVTDSIFYFVGNTYSQQSISTTGSYQENLSFHPSYPNNNNGNGFIAKFAPEENLSISNFQEHQFVVYPNPVYYNEITIFGIMKDNYELKIHNILGQNVYDTKLTNSSNQTIDITNLSSGTYTLNIYENKKNVYTKKIIKK